MRYESSTKRIQLICWCTSYYSSRYFVIKLEKCIIRYSYLNKTENVNVHDEPNILVVLHITIKIYGPNEKQ